MEDHTSAWGGEQRFFHGGRGQHVSTALPSSPVEESTPAKKAKAEQQYLLANLGPRAHVGAREDFWPAIARYTSQPKLAILEVCNSLVVIYVLSCIKELYETVGEQYPPVQQQPCLAFSAN